MPTLKLANNEQARHKAIRWIKAACFNDTESRRWCEQRGMTFEPHPQIGPNGGLKVTKEAAVFHLAFAEEIKKCFANLSDSQKTDIREGRVCDLCKETCRHCYTAKAMYEAVLLDGVWQECCKAVGITNMELE